MEDIKIIYPNYNEILLLNYFNNNVLKSSNNDKGKFFIENNVLKIIWNDKHIEEEFIKIKNDETDLNEPLSSYIFNEFIDNSKEIYEIKGNNNEHYYEHEINIWHESWCDKCIINYNDKKIKRLSNNENASYYLNNNILIIYWENWDSEIFILKDDIYYHQKDILLHHQDWSDYCKLDDINIYRKYNNEDKGKYKLDNNKLIIEWEKWNKELFYKINDIFYYDEYIKFLNYDNESYIFNLYNNILYNYLISQNLIIENGKFKINDYKLIVDSPSLILDTYFKYVDNNIIPIKYIKKDFILVKNQEEINLSIDFINDCTTNISNFKFISYKSDILKIFLIDISKYEEYILINDKYYLKEDKKFILIDEYREKNIYNINFIEKYFYNEINKVYYLYNNNKYYICDSSKDSNKSLIKIYNLYQLKDFNDYILLPISNFNENIYNLFNNIPLLENKNYLDTIYSIDKFREIYKDFDLSDNDNIQIIYEWRKCNMYSNIFYSKYGIDLLYNTLELYKNIELNNNILIIINGNSQYIKETLLNIPRNHSIIINCKIDDETDYTVLEKVVNNYKKYAITKSINNSNYYIVKYIFDKIIKDSYKIIYFVEKVDNYDNLFKLDNKENNNIFRNIFKSFYINIIKLLTPFILNDIDLIKIIIINYIINKTNYNLFDKNIW